MLAIGGNSASTGYNLTRSLRFRASAGASLSRTPSNTGNRQIFTYSAWIKRGAISAQNLLYTYVSTSDVSYIYFNSSAQLGIATYNGGSFVGEVITTQVFRDPSAWYHIVIAVDTTQATASNRIKMYVNGSQITAFSTATYPPQNTNFYFNAQYITRIGASDYPSAPAYFDGYHAEFNWIDGQALTPSSFGSTNTLTGVWQPARYTGSYGTNGFYLPFTSIGSASTSSYSGNFNGSSQYLTFPNSSNFAFGTAAFTVEFFINGASNNDKFILGGRSAIGTMHITTGGSGSTAGVLRYVGSSTIVSTNLITDSSYHHCAIVRDGSSNVKLYVDGALVASGTDTTNYTTTSGTWYIGTNDTSAGNNLLSAALSNLRVVKGTAVYTAAFTPPSAPLTAVSGTSLLTLQSSTIIDNSGNSVSISNTGTVVTSVSYPFVGNVGADFSGNNNNWTTNNISLNAGVTYDSMTDVPTLTSATAANFAVLNPLDIPSSTSLTNGNLLFTNTAASAWKSVTSTISFSSGKFYCEFTSTNAAIAMAGIVRSSWNANIADSRFWADSLGYSYYSVDGQKYNNGSGASYGATYTTNDIIGIALDLDVGTLAFYKNGVSQGTAYTGLVGTFKFCAGVYDTSSACVFNFGQRPFTYTPPTGFVALNTYNLPTSTIVKGNTVMDATLYTGTGASLSVTNTASFKPDLVWVKGRSGATDHAWYDSVRGTTKQLESNNTGAETTEATGLTAFGSAGFTVGALAQMNTSAATYVGWQWQAGQGSSSSNTSGSITSTVSVNASAGFSVVTWTGASGTNTIGHGLGVAPSWIVTKSRSATGGWPVYHASIGGTGAVQLESTGATNTNIGYWNNTAPTSSVFTTSITSFPSGTTFVAYCWTPIAGYSAFGGYTGNGSTNGAFIYTGFRPRFVLVKQTDAAGNWIIWDTARSTYNQMQDYLVPNSSGAELNNVLVSIDALSNGFKCRTSDDDINGSGNTYIYIAFAENPFKNALAR